MTRVQRGLVLLLAVLIRVTWWSLMQQHPSSDDLQYALMAEAIRHREAFPLVAWGIGYGGTLTTSWMLAGLFAIFGPVLGVALTYGVLLSIAQLWIWSTMAERLQRGAGCWVGLLLAVPSAHMGMMLQQLSYADGLAVGALLVWMAAAACRQGALDRWRSACLGAVAGYLIYVHPIPSVFLAALFVLWRQRVRWSVSSAVGGFLVGIAPLIVANVINRGMTIRRIGARVLSMNAAQFSAEASPGGLIGRIVHQVVVGLKEQPRLILEAFSSDRVVTIVGILSCALVVGLIVRARHMGSVMRWAAWPVIIASLAGNVLLGQNARARFLMPAYAAASVLAGVGASVGGAPAQGAALAIVAFNGWGTVERIHAAPPGIPYETAIRYLRSQGAQYGYADFWQALPLTFLSRGGLEVASTATDARGFYDRTVHVTRRVDQATELFYVFDTDTDTQRPFVAAFEALAQRTGLRYERADMPPLRIYSHLSRPVRPQELDAMYRSMKPGAP